MVTIKHWCEWNKDREHSTRTIIIYGAGINAQFCLNADIVPACFCDVRAEQIRSIAHQERAIPVISPGQLKEMAAQEDLDILLSITNTHQEAAAEYLQALLINIPTSAVVYAYLDANHPNRIANFKMGNKIVFDSGRYYRSMRDQSPYKEMLREGYYERKTLTEEDYQEIRRSPPVLFQEGRPLYGDMTSQHVNYREGRRVTVGQPSSPKGRIHLFGDSVLRGAYRQDRYTIASQLQARMTEGGLSYSVRNHGMDSMALPAIFYLLKKASLQQGDVIVLCKQIYANPDETTFYLQYFGEVASYCRQKGCQVIYCDLPTIWDRCHKSQWEEHIVSKTFFQHNLKINRRARSMVYGAAQRNQIPVIPINALFYDSHELLCYDYTHYTDQGCAILADQLYHTLIAFLCETQPDKEHTRKLETEALINIVEWVAHGCHDYVASVKKRFPQPPSGEAGAIVMNCNPFTKGHQYLIEYAAAQVERLYIFVVQEDQSEFTFEERLFLVQENTSHLDNVEVLESGKFIISSFTFPGYFSEEKAIIQDKPDSQLDLLLFALKIAPALQIKKRFVGEEPYCNTTRHYNQEMKQILPTYGIEVVEVERFGLEDDDYISASRVRELLTQENEEEARRYLPPATISFLERRRQSPAERGTVC